MKTSSGKALIYDDQCPMCTAYSSAFVKSGILEKGERIGFHELEGQDFICSLDVERASREIPLVDLKTGEILYGMEALAFLLGRRAPLLEKLIRRPMLFYLLSKFYAFVSLNRRILVPSGKGKGKYDFPPPYDRISRVRLLVFSVLFSVFASALFGISTGHYILLPGLVWKMVVAVGSGWVLQLALSAGMIRNRELHLDYAAHLGVLMVIGVLILIPSLVISKYTHYMYPIVPAMSVVISSFVMLWQHIKRVKSLGLSQGYTLSWFLCLQLTASISIWVFY